MLAPTLITVHELTIEIGDADPCPYGEREFGAMLADRYGEFVNQSPVAMVDLTQNTEVVRRTSDSRTPTPNPEP